MRFALVHCVIGILVTMSGCTATVVVPEGSESTVTEARVLKFSGPSVGSFVVKLVVDQKRMRLVLSTDEKVHRPELHPPQPCEVIVLKTCLDGIQEQADLRFVATGESTTRLGRLKRWWVTHSDRTEINNFVERVSVAAPITCTGLRRESVVFQVKLALVNTA